MSDITRVTRYRFVNAYLVREDDGLTLIDALLPGGAKAILAAAERAGAPIVRIALTHAHGDHIGSLDALATALPGVEVSISARDARLLARDRSLDPGEPQSRLRGDLRGATTAPSRLLMPGDRVGSLEVLAAPGHTPGHVAFLDPRDGTLYCGDAFTTVGRVATTAKGPLRFPFAAMATWDRPTALASARALRDRAPQRLAPGHGRVALDPVSAMDAAIARGA